jgi:hypothetical protein
VRALDAESGEQPGGIAGHVGERIAALDELLRETDVAVVEPGDAEFLGAEQCRDPEPGGRSDGCRDEFSCREAR